jgi:Tfp pilus assembly protein PilF
MRPDQQEALRLAAEALELWEADRLEEADARHLQALSLADPRHSRTPDIHSQYAAFLSRMHRPTEAGQHFERALQLELRNDPDEASAAVVSARYVLGEHYLAIGEPESARRVVAPSLAAAPRPLGWLVEAVALHQSGAFQEARDAAKQAVALASDPGQRERIRDRLGPLLDDAPGPP